MKKFAMVIIGFEHQSIKLENHYVLTVFCHGAPLCESLIRNTATNYGAKLTISENSGEYRLELIFKQGWNKNESPLEFWKMQSHLYSELLVNGWEPFAVTPDVPFGSENHLWKYEKIYFRLQYE